MHVNRNNISVLSGYIGITNLSLLVYTLRKQSELVFEVGTAVARLLLSDIQFVFLL
jgi:hypothetical protein